jgi:hypothetical protein
MDTNTNKEPQMIATKDFGMFTDFGNDAVDAIVRSAKILKMDWPQVYKELENLAKHEDFAEAMDTEVREIVYSRLDFKTAFYF